MDGVRTLRGRLDPSNQPADHRNHRWIFDADPDEAQPERGGALALPQRDPAGEVDKCLGVEGHRSYAPGHRSGDLSSKRPAALALAPAVRGSDRLPQRNRPGGAGPDTVT